MSTPLSESLLHSLEWVVEKSYSDDDHPTGDDLADRLAAAKSTTEPLLTIAVECCRQFMEKAGDALGVDLNGEDLLKYEFLTLVEAGVDALNETKKGAGR